VSGGFGFFVSRVAEAAGFDTYRSNELVFEGSKLSGQVAEPIFGRVAKRQTLVDLMTKRGIERDDTLALGDGANDLGMFEAAGFGIAYRPHPVLAEAAAAVIEHGDLTGVLYAQGYRCDEIVVR
jgi:phosphoserine phosphatase